MARLKTLGFELQSLTGGHEVDVTNGACSIDTTIARSGAASMKVNSAGLVAYIKFQHRSASAAKIFVRVWIYITAYPAANTTILGLVDNAETDQGGGLKLNTDGTVNIIGGSGTAYATVGAASPVIPKNEWHCLELSYDDNDANNTLAARLDEQQFATGNGQDMASGSVSVTLGDIDASTTTFYVDDVAVNDNTSSEASWPGMAGKLLYTDPNAAGDANTFATQTGGVAGASNNFTRVNQTTPDDATTFNGSSVLNQEDLFNITDISGIIGASDTIKLVEVHGRFRNSTADATAKITFELLKAAAGTKTSSAAITPNSTTWRTNKAGGTLPLTAPIVAYLDPDGLAWTNSDAWQIGYKLTTGPGTAGRRIDVTKVWAIVEYVPFIAPSRPNHAG